MNIAIITTSMATFLLTAAAAPAVPDAPVTTRTDRRDGVLRPPPPLCDGKLCDRTRPFRFSGGTTF